MAGSSTKEVLRIEPNGKITWVLDGEEIVVKDRSVLALALLDCVVKLTSMNYDYSKLDPDLYKDYQTFLKTKNKLI